jgi:hypothetical protein
MKTASGGSRRPWAVAALGLALCVPILLPLALMGPKPAADFLVEELPRELAGGAGPMALLLAWILALPAAGALLIAHSLRRGRS